MPALRASSDSRLLTNRVCARPVHKTPSTASQNQLAQSMAAVPITKEEVACE